MDGRIEQELKTVEKIKRLCEDKPQFLQEFVNYMYSNGLEKQTAYDYMRETIYYLNFISNKLNISLCDLQIQKITNDMLDLYFISKEYRMDNRTGKMIKTSDEIKQHQYFGLKKFHEFMKQKGYIDYNPLNGIKTPKVDWRSKPVIVMNDKEIEKLFENIQNGVGSEMSKKRQEKWKTRDKAIMTVFLMTAYRASACAALNVADIDFTRQSIVSIDKGGKRSEHYLSKSAMQILRVWLEDRKKFMEGYEPCDALFISNRRKRIVVKSMSKLLEKYTEGINKHLTLHKLRSTSANKVYHESSGDIKLTKEHLNHANYNYIDRYTKTPEDKKKEVVKLLSNSIKL